MSNSVRLLWDGVECHANVDEVYRLLKPWVKPRYKAPPCVKLDNGQWARTPDEAAEQRRRQYEATFKGQVITCAELAIGGEKRAEDREPCWVIVPPTVDEVFDLILSASRSKAPCVDGISCLELVAGPWRCFCNPRSRVFVCKELCPSCGRGGRIVATIPSGKNKTRGVMHNDHVGKILGRWIRPKLLQIEPLLFARSQAIGSARRGTVMTQFATRVFFNVAKIRGLSAAAVFCDLAAAYYSVIRQYVVGTDLPEQRLLVLMDILGLDPAQRAELLAFLRAEGSLLKSARMSTALQQLVRDMNEVRPRSRACLVVVARMSRLLIWSSSSCLARCSRRCAMC